MKPKILLIEDEESLALGLDYNLTEEGYYVVWADNGKSGIEKFLTDFWIWFSTVLVCILGHFG